MHNFVWQKQNFRDLLVVNVVFKVQKKILGFCRNFNLIHKFSNGQLKNYFETILAQPRLNLALAFSPLAPLAFTNYKLS